MLVIFFHNFDYLKLSGLGWIGVDLFFVLSGFLITRILLNTKKSKGYFFNFYMKRTLRIFPLYFLFVLGCILLVVFFDIERLNPIKDYWGYFITYTPNLLFYKLNGFVPKFAMGHLWSLAIEEHFYLIWPLMVYLFNQKNLIVLAIIAIVGSCVLGLFMLAEEHSWMVVYTFTFTRLSTIMLGALLAVLLGNYKSIVEKLVIPVFLISGIVIVGFYLKLYFIDHIEFNFFLFHPSTSIIRSNSLILLVFAIFFVSILCFCLGKNIFSKMLSLKPFVLLGKYSYGIYVFHFPVYFLLRNDIGQVVGTPFNVPLLGSVLVSVISVMITLSISVLIYHVFEKRFLDLKKRFNASNA